jgi:uncharacterized protein (DUF1800 family)
MSSIVRPISRSSFFESLFSRNGLRATPSLAVHTSPLTQEDVYHLLKRSCFTIDIDFAFGLIGKTATEVVDLLIENASFLPQNPVPFDLNKGFPNPGRLSDPQSGEQRFNNLLRIFEENDKLVNWWLDLMKADTKSLSEKTTLLWHSHFTTECRNGEPIPVQFMYRQNKLFREMFLGNLRDFLVRITLDGAMLQYLNGSQNVFYAPNENYARELFELYAIGIGDGHYSENDIRQAARVLTGWQANHFNEDGALYEPWLQPDRFSLEEKNVFGERFVVDYTVTQANVLKHSIEKLVDVILTKKTDYVAKFIAGKIYRHFVYSKPITEDNPVITELAETLKSSGFDIKPVLRKLLTSQHFFDPEMRGVMIKSPVEHLLSFIKHFPVPVQQVAEWSKDFGQELLNPPNVSGWKGYRSWITTKTLPGYIRIFNKIINEKSNRDIGQWASNFGGFSSSHELTKNICLLFLGQISDGERLEKLENALLGGAPFYEWGNLSQNTENAGLRVKALLKEMFKMPEFYLC